MLGSHKRDASPAVAITNMELIARLQRSAALSRCAFSSVSQRFSFKPSRSACTDPPHTFLSLDQTSRFCKEKNWHRSLHSTTRSHDLRSRTRRLMHRGSQRTGEGCVTTKHGGGGREVSAIHLYDDRVRAELPLDSQNSEPTPSPQRLRKVDGGQSKPVFKRSLLPQKSQQQEHPSCSLKIPHGSLPKCTSGGGMRSK